MKKKFSMYHLLVALLTFSLMMPAGMASAEPSAETGSLTIHKFEQDPGAGQGNPDGSELEGGIEGDALPGVEFTLIQTHSYNSETDKWTKLDEGKTYVETTGSDGRIHIPNIDLGRYSVQETDGPDHVALNEEEYFVDIPMTDPNGEFINYHVHIYPKNETIRGEVKLKKKDGDTDQGLKGVTFTLYHADGTVVKEGLQTNNSGHIVVDHLAYGEYYFQETATVGGYLLNGEKVKFTVSKPGEQVKVSLKNFKEPEVEKSVDETAVNRGEIVTYTLSINLPGDIANYESFVVTDILHENLEYIAGSQSNPKGFTFHEDGQKLTWTADPTQLSPGTMDITFDARVSENAEANVGIDNEATIDYNNSYETGGKTTPTVTVTPTVGSLTVIKQDGNTEETLEGAVFDLIQEGNVIATGTTDENGVIHFDELDYGEYQLVETKAPNGYNKLTKPIEVVVSEEFNEQIIKVDNYKSGWTLPKTGGIGTLLFTLVGLTIMGAALVLYIRYRRGETA